MKPEGHDGSTTQTFNPLDFLRQWKCLKGEVPTGNQINNVIYNEKLKAEDWGTVSYRQANDGTFTFVVNKMCDIFDDLFKCKARPKPEHAVAEGEPLVYIVGPMTLKETPKDKIPMICGGEYPGVEQEFTMPIVCVTQKHWEGKP